MAKIGAALVAALVAIAFGKILLSMSGRFLRFWLENNGNLCELKSSENVGAAVSDVTGACCKSDITPLGFRWCCNESCNCNGNHVHYLNGLVSWEGYTTWLGSWVYCVCAEDDSLKEEESGTAKMSVTRCSTIYYPVANVINSTLYDNGRLCNPSGIVVGSNACFVVEFPGLTPPSSDIKWTVVEGSARFVGGDTGSKVYVTSDVPNQVVKLRVQIGDCVSRPIEFTAFTVEPLSVKTTVWIVGNKEGAYFARTENQVRSMMAEVNRIYEQIGVSFYIDSISYTNRDDWLDISVRRDGKDVCDFVKRRQLVNLSQNTNGFELYFINRISENATANKTNFGIVISTNATAFTIAHEIGHSFGCSDIYCVKKSDGRTPLSSNNVDITRAELDWSNGAGCRYYSSDITQSKIIKRLIMCGHGYRERGDLSSGSVYGYTKYDDEGLVDIGFFRGSSRRSPIYHR